MNIITKDNSINHSTVTSMTKGCPGIFIDVLENGWSVKEMIPDSMIPESFFKGLEQADSGHGVDMDLALNHPYPSAS